MPSTRKRQASEELPRRSSRPRRRSSRLPGELPEAPGVLPGVRILSNEKSLAVKPTVCLKNCIIILMLERKCREVLRSRFHYSNSKTKSQFHLMYLLFVHTTIIHNHSDALVGSIGSICLIFGGRAILFFRKFFPQQALPCSALWRLTFHVILATVIVVLIIFRT